MIRNSIRMWPATIVMVLYIIQAGLIVATGDWRKAGMWLCYAAANFFLIIQG